MVSPIHQPPLTFDEILPNATHMILSTYFSALSCAESNYPVEYSAAVKIQSLWRRHRARSSFFSLRSSTVLVQRLIRGFSTRKLCLKLKSQHQENVLTQQKHSAATLIQRHFRGYQSRKHKGDFYKSKALLNSVIEINSKTRAELQSLSEKNQLEQELITKEKEETQFLRTISCQHHLLSTACQAGIYKPPIKSSISDDVPIEELINQNTRDQLRKPKKRKINVEKFRLVVTEAPPGPFLDKSVVDYLRNKPNQSTIRTAEPFEIEKRKSNIERVVNDQFIKKVHSKLFTNVSKPKPITFEPTVRCSDSFNDSRPAFSRGRLLTTKPKETFDEAHEEFRKSRLLKS
ncbi:hypothetical protein P9112_007798 [Eukaryota sp. TZLM1-RC]